MAKKQAKQEKSLSEIEVVVPWQEVIDLINPHYIKASLKGGRPPYQLGPRFCASTSSCNTICSAIQL